MRIINKIIIHHSASSWGSKSVIDTWHRKRGFSCVGYQLIINNGYLTYQEYREKQYKNYADGLIEIGRNMNIQGAHCKGYNSESIGICLIGEKKFTDSQFKSLEIILKDLVKDFQIKEIGPHKDYNETLCPEFNVNEFLRKIELERYTKNKE